MTSGENDKPSGRAKALVQLIASIGGVISSGALAVGILWTVLHWIYGELNSLRTIAYEAKTEIAETRANVNSLSNKVEKMDGKLDHLLIRP